MPTEDLFDAIRRAALEPDAWFDVQDRASEFMGSFCSQLATVDHSHGNAFWSRTTRHLELDDYFSEFMPFSEPVRFAVEHPHWRVFSDYDYIDEAGIARSDFYHLTRPFGLGYRLGLRLLDTPDVSRALVFLWRPEQGHVQAPELEKLKRIEQQLRLAAHVAAMLPETYLPVCGLLDGLERASVAAAVVDADAGIRHANSQAEALLRSADGLVVRRGRLVVEHRETNDRFKLILASGCRVLREGRAEPCGGTLMAPRPSQRAPYNLAIAALPLEHRFLAPNAALFLVLIRGERTLAADEPILRRMFGLTKAEDAVCKMFADGSSVAEIAAARHVAISTVRQQIKVIMSKLGVSRQAELMRTVLHFNSM